MDWIDLPITALLILINAFFVLAEFAFIKIRSSRVEELSRAGGMRSALVRRIYDNIDAYLSTIQLGITMASLGIGWIGEPALARLIEPLFKGLPLPWAQAASWSIAFGIAFFLITLSHVVVGENVPKLIAIRRPTRMALLTALPLCVFHVLLFLPMSLLNSAAHLVLRMIGLRPTDDPEAAHSDEELKILLAHCQESGTLPLSRLLLFENLFDFGYTRVQDVMRRSSEIAFLSIDRPWEQNLETVRRRKFSRYPLCGKGLDDVRGIVHMKDLLLAGAGVLEGSPDLRQSARPVFFLQENAPLERALIEFRQKRGHLALVRGAGGHISGLLTLEDVIEELVGDIRDEFEPPHPLLLSEVVVAPAIDTALPQEPKEDILRGMLKSLCAARPDISFEEAWNVVWRREQAFNSALGGGVAIFHGRLPKLERPALSIGICPEGLDFSAPDGKPVHAAFLLITALKEPGTHLRLLSRVATLASDETFRRNLLRAQSPGEVLDILQTFGHGRS
ncbi:MAG: CNNM domain-containing protein [Elusimicrobiota bacterium]|jgi:CBS domain containing-hemolysin-like protein/mannitol/fructose-specific phosphotransferase system IIA component (Ntr-type)